ncbi:MAG: tyrosine--tRNA ligase [Patescibacteria group bacterium]|nr:tyrosine--tRNA ligase [Patescibacteria group bacterium]
MKFSVTQKVFERFPDAKFGVLLIQGINNTGSNSKIADLLKQQIKTTSKQYNHTAIKDIPQIKSWREVFESLGLNRDFLPSHEALSSRVISKGDLPNINPLVDIYNIVSLKYLIPIGGHDTDKAPEIRIDETTGKETFQVMNSKEILNVEKGELAYLTEDKILTRHFVWRQSETSKTDRDTKNVFIPIDNAAGDMTEKQIKQIADELIELITKHLGGKASLGIVNKVNPLIDLKHLPRRDLINPAYGTGQIPIKKHDFNSVTAILASKGIDFEEITFTDDKISARDKDTSKDENYDPQNAIKTLILKTKNEFIGVILRGSDKIDEEKLKELIGKWTVVDKGTLLKKFGFEPGCVNPFCLDISIIIDKKASKIDTWSMGAGEATRGMNVKTNKALTKLKNSRINLISLQTNEMEPKQNSGIQVNTDPKEIEEFVTRNIVEIFTKEELTKRMSTGKQLRAYIGYDVTGPDLHLGHGSTLMKLQHWQDLGHHVIALIGDDTSRIGDHSDKLEKRKRLTDKEIDHNKAQFKKQFLKILDPEKTEVRYNSEWLDKLKFRDVISLASIFSVQQMIDRENFAKRLKNKTTIGLEEILYPLMQGYDSVALEVDLEMGATDQTFNLLAGRKIMEAFGMKPQSVITMPFVTGTDGRKMGKSLNNYIPMLAPANDIFGGIMSTVDEVIIEYFERLTRLPLEEINKMKKELKAGKVHPMELKKKLAFEVTKIYFDEKSANKAQENFEKTVQKGETPEEMEELEINSQHSALELAKELVEKGIIASNADAKRLIQQGGLQINDEKVTNFDQKLDLKPGTVIKVGKRKFVRIKA